MCPPLALIGLALLSACLKAERPAVMFETARDSVELGEVSYLDELPVGEISLLNTGTDELIITPLGVDGDGADLLWWTGGADFTTVPPESSFTLQVGLEAADSLWASGDYGPELSIELGTIWADPRTWGDDETWEAQTLGTVVGFTLLCDLDGDSYEAEACGGDDCDDDDPDTWPGAPESSASGVDRNCDGVIEEGMGDHVALDTPRI